MEKEKVFNMPTFREVLEKDGYDCNEEYYCFKKKGDKEVTLEFCIGDICVAAYEKQSLLEPKIRCLHPLEALVKAKELEGKYL